MADPTGICSRCSRPWDDHSGPIENMKCEIGPRPEVPKEKE